MAPYPITNIRIDPELKAEAKGILEDLWLNLSSAINIYLRAIVRQRGDSLRHRHERPEEGRAVGPSASNCQHIEGLGALMMPLSKDGIERLALGEYALGGVPKCQGAPIRNFVSSTCSPA